MEKSRLKSEAQAEAQIDKERRVSAKAAANAKKRKPAEINDGEKPVVLSAPKAKGKSKKEPEFFTAKASSLPAKASSSPGK